MLLNASWAYGKSASEGTDSRGDGGSSCTDQQYDCARYDGDNSTDRAADSPDYPDNDAQVSSDFEPSAYTGSAGGSSPPDGGVASGGGAMADASTSVVAFATLSGVFALAALASAVARRVLS